MKMNKEKKLLSLVIVVILVTIFAGAGLFYLSSMNTPVKFGYVEAVLSQQGCSINTATKINDISYRCNEGTENYTEIVFEDSLKKDFDRNGSEETFIVWSENNGGSGTFKYIGIYNGTSSIKSPLAIGDRIKIDRLFSENEIIFLDLTIHSEEDPLCCPTLETTNRYLWNNDALILYK